jgi:hypothetical protein
MSAKSLSTALLLVSTLGIAGCIEQGTKVYPYSSQQAMRMLGGGSIPGVVGIKNGAEQIPDGGLRWTGRKGRSCEAVIKDVGENQVEITPSCSVQTGSKLDEAEQEMASFAFTEYVESTMEKRPLNSEKIRAKAMATAIGSIDAIGEELDRHVAESKAREAEYRRNAEANKAAATFGQPTGMGDTSFGQPTAPARP